MPHFVVVSSIKRGAASVNREFHSMVNKVGKIKRGAASVNREFHSMVNKVGKVNNCGSGP
jgi:hypothetical protein